MDLNKPQLHWKLISLALLVVLMAASRAAVSADRLSATAHAGRTYYVSPSGSDTNEGLSASAPWRTCAKVDTTPFLPGDTILFQRGGQWHEALRASSDGAAGAPITYAAYGSGPKPVFWGSDILKNAGFVPRGTNVYAYSTGTAVHSVLVNHVFLIDVHDLAHQKVVRDPADTPNCWKYSDGVLTISTPPGDDPRTDGKVYTGCTRVDVISSSAHRHLVFRNLVAEETALYDDGYDVRVMGSVDVLLDGCEAYRGGKHNFGCINSTQVRFVNCRAAYAMPNQDASLYVSYADTDPSGQNATTSEYDDCTADHMDDPSRPGFYYLSFVCHGGQLGPLIFKNFATHHGMFAILQDAAATKQTFLFQGGLIDDADYEVFAHGGVTDGATFTGNAAVDVYGSRNIFQNLKMENILPVNGGQTGYNSAIVMRAGAENNVIRFSTVVMNPAASRGYPCLTLVAPGLHTEWYGNILLSNGVAVMPYYFAPSPEDAPGTDYNFYPSMPTFGDAGLTLAQWHAATDADSHSLTGDPRLAERDNGDYHLQPSSPAIDTVPISVQLLPAMATDFDRKPRLAGHQFDMGAFEFRRHAGKVAVLEKGH